MSNRYSKENIRKNRTFPIKNTVFLILCIVAQILVIFFVVTFNPRPLDVIKEYTVTVEPDSDGNLDIEYSFVWQALDPEEPLSWVHIGMPHKNYRIYPERYTKNIVDHGYVIEDDYVVEQLEFDKEYKGGDILEFGFKIYVLDMLCKDEGGYFYEFVPGWFNSIPIERYAFRWKADQNVIVANGAALVDGYYTWSGSLEPGEYEKLFVRYGADTFDGKNTVEYMPFNDSGAYNALDDEKTGVAFLGVFIILLIVLAEVYIIDSYVSYSRGRGFLKGYGERVHVYGRSNPHYVSTRSRHISSSGYRGGGCACACACACAGGGRAGCSQKDTYENKLQE